MDARLNYYTSITDKQPSTFPIEKIKYHTSLQGSDIAFENLKKMNNKLDETNVITLAYLAMNPYLTDDERAKYSNHLKELAMKEYLQMQLRLRSFGGVRGGDISPSYINDIVCRNKDSSTDLTECDN